jgi:hypothetical protein
MINGNLVPKREISGWEFHWGFWEFNFVPLASMAVWLHFMIAITAWAIDENSINPDEDLSVFNGNIRTAAGGHSFCVKISTSWSSERLGGVLKKWRI